MSFEFFTSFDWAPPVATQFSVLSYTTHTCVHTYIHTYIHTTYTHIFVKLGHRLWRFSFLLCHSTYIHTSKNVSVSSSFHCSISLCTACSRLSFLLFGQIAASEQEAQTTRCHVTTAVKDAKEEIVEGDIQPPSPEQLPAPTSVPATTYRCAASKQEGRQYIVVQWRVQWFNGSMVQWQVQ